MTEINRSVALVGRPNVGKSRMFNRMLGRRQAIVHDRPGVTRDLVTAIVADGNFTLMDTGGIGYRPQMTPEVIHAATEEQVDFAIQAASLIILVCDGLEGCTEVDRDIANRLRRYGKQVIVAVNKMENRQDDAAVEPFFSLALGEPLALSAEHNIGFGELFKRVHAVLGPPPPVVVENKPPRRVRIALCGRPNVGKSSIGNALLKDKRFIVSDIAGTTRDAVEHNLDFVREGNPADFIDTIPEGLDEPQQAAEEPLPEFREPSDEDREEGGEWLAEALSRESSAAEPPAPEAIPPVADSVMRFTLVDTAGLKPKRKFNDSLDYFSTLRTEEAYQEAHVAILVLDALSGVTKHDKKIAGDILEAGTGLVIVVNKWDFAITQFRKELIGSFANEAEFRQSYMKSIREELFFLPDSPILFVSAHTGLKLERILIEAWKLDQRMDRKLSTSKVNQCVKSLIARNEPKISGGRRFRIYYALHVGSRPFKIRAFCNRVERLDDSYLRYLQNGFQRIFKLSGCPLRFDFVGKPKENPYYEKRTGVDSHAVNTLAKHGKSRVEVKPKRRSQRRK